MLTVRLIQSGFCDAATNMAIDEALFLSYKEGVSPPVFRIYGWEPSALSIGSSQKPEKVLNLENCKKQNISFVRRPTGGGVIFHDNELTYSFILAQSDLKLSCGIKESFEKITSFLITTYKNLGATASFAKDTLRQNFQGHTIADFCFSRKEEYDILINGKKIGGNAQRRKKNIILQHGSLPFSVETDRIKTLLYDPKLIENLSVTSINEFSNTKIDFDKLSKVLIKAFEKHFKAKLVLSSLTKEEKELTEKLKKEKYSQRSAFVLRLSSSRT